MTTARSHRFSTLAGAAAIALLLTAAGCAGSAGTADAPGGGGSSGDTVALYTGMWEGSFDVSMVAGGMSVVLNHDGTNWSGEVVLEAQGESTGVAIESFALTDDGCSFQIYIEGADIIFTARIEEGSMTGMMEAYTEGNLVADGTFQLKKK